MNVKEEFRNWLLEKELNESPIALGDMDGLQSKEEYKDLILNNFKKENLKKSKKLFNDYNYIIGNNTFYVVLKNELVLFIVFTEKNKTFNIKVVRNLSTEKNLAFKVYRAILNLPQYSDIITGDALTISNLKSHKKALETFNIYIRIKDKDKLINDEKELDLYYKRDREDEVFVLKESMQFKYLSENFNTSLGEYIEFKI